MGPGQAIIRRLDMKLLKKVFWALFVLCAAHSVIFCAEKKFDREHALVIDVCTSWEFKQKHYPEAVNIPVDELEGRVKELGEDTERPIVVYCASGVRAEEAKEILNGKGFKNVLNGGSLEEMNENKKFDFYPVAIS